MFRHIVLVRWSAESSEEQRGAARAALETLPSLISEIRAARFGSNVGSGPNHHDFAVVMDFDDRDAFRRYIQHEAHRAYVDGPAKAAVGALAVLQHEW